jgi:hypothetical protein
MNTNTPQGKRVFVKDMAYYLFPPNHQPASIAPSLASAVVDDKTTTTSNGATPPTNGTNGTNSTNYTNGTNGTNHTNHTNDNHNTNGTNGTNGTHKHHPNPNPTVIPLPILRNFHFTFLIRHPRRSMPSYYRCTIPPLSAKTGWESFLPSEAGYDELRRLFDYLRQEGLVDGSLAQQHNGNGDGDYRNGETKNGSGNGGVKVTVVDADDLLDKPAEVVRAFCEDVGIDFHPGMLKWEDAEGQKMAVEAFEKWNGWHDDAIGSTELRARTQPKVSLLFYSLTEDGMLTGWRRKHPRSRKRTRSGGRSMARRRRS